MGYDYLVDVLQRVGEYPAARVAELTQDCGINASLRISCAPICIAPYRLGAAAIPFTL
jgi:hypothetical protein